MDQNGKPKLKQILGFWKKKSASGKDYLSGTVKEDLVLKAGTTIHIYKNEYKNADDPNDRSPHWKAFEMPPLEMGPKTWGYQKQENTRPIPTPKIKPMPLGPEMDESDVPF